MFVLIGDRETFTSAYSLSISARAFGGLDGDLARAAMAKARKRDIVDIIFAVSFEKFRAVEPIFVNPNPRFTPSDWFSMANSHMKQRENDKFSMHQIKKRSNSRDGPAGFTICSEIPRYSCTNLFD